MTDSRFWQSVALAVALMIVLVLLVIAWSWLTPAQSTAHIEAVDLHVTARQLERASVHTLGNGPVILLEFADFQCPDCEQFARETFPQINAKLFPIGAVTFVHVDDPLPVHPFAMQAAQTASCLDDDAGVFWLAYRELFPALKAGTLSIEDIAQRSQIRPGTIDPARIRACVEAHDLIDTTLARDLKVTGTPTLFLGRQEGLEDARGLHLTWRIRGMVSYEVLQNLVYLVDHAKE
jgi:protein-disulfide isomerase